MYVTLFGTSVRSTETSLYKCVLVDCIESSVCKHACTIIVSCAVFCVVHDSRSSLCSVANPTANIVRFSTGFTGSLAPSLTSSSVSEPPHHTSLHVLQWTDFLIYSYVQNHRYRCYIYLKYFRIVCFAVVAEDWFGIVIQTFFLSQKWLMFKF